MPARAPVTSFALRSPRRPVPLQCEALESRTVPAANQMGINLSGVWDGSADRLFADAMKSARRPSNFGTWDGTPPLDSKGWATTDFSVVAWHTIPNMNGTYRLSFNGRADISASWGGTTFANVKYDAPTNTTTADVTYWPSAADGLLLNFANTRRTANGPTNSGITNVKLMRPIGQGSATSYDSSVTFSQPIRDLVNKFSVVRMMDDTGSNGGTELNGVWANRRPADYASQASSAAATGMAWEYAIQFWNETDRDAWVNIPFPADDEYVRQLATLLKNTLEPGRKLYVEYSNELWNAFGPYPAIANHDAAVAEVQANPNSPLNYDHSYPGDDSTGWGLANRRMILRGAQISTIFRQVFGDAEMMSRVRPVFMTQFGYADGWLASGLDYTEDYLNNPKYQANPNPASYYFYGAGGSAYQDPNWSLGDGITVDQIFATMPYNFDTAIRKDVDWTAAFGLKRIAYEGGPSLDNLVEHTGVPNSVLDAAWADPRMRSEMVENHNSWSASGGDLVMYFTSTGGHEWGFTRDTYDLNTQKLKAIDDLNASPAAAVTYGKLAPIDLLRDDFKLPYWQGHIDDMRSDSLTNDWNGAMFRVDSAGSFNVRATATSSNGGQVEVFVDGRSLGTITVPPGGDTVTLPAGTLQPGVHGILLRARAGTFGLSRVSVTSGGAAAPNIPTNLNAAASSQSTISLNWTDNASNETGFLLERATNAAFSAGFATMSLGANTTAYTDSGLSSGTTYFYRVRATNAVGSSGNSNTASATTPAPAASSAIGLAATYFDNLDLTGPSATRVDSNVDFYWPDSPIAGIAGDTFSTRWLGQVTALESGNHQFRTLSDDGVRLWVNGKLVVNNWTDHASTFDVSAAIPMTAGAKYDVRLEYYDRSGGAVARLDWKRPGASDFGVIPPNQLTPAAGGPALFADSFDTGLGRWTVANGRWNAQAGQAGRETVYASTGASLEETSLAGTSSWTNYAVSAWVNLSNLGGGLSLLGRVQDATHFYQLEIKRDGSGSPGWFLIKRDGNTWTTLANGSLSYTAGSWLRLRLTMTGNSLTAESSTDGSTYSQLGKATDSRYSAGRIGLRAWYAPAYFDDVCVQGT